MSDPLVLCVDDEVPILNSLGRVLRREPYRLVTTARPSDVIDLVQEQDVSVIVVDQRMPDMKGTDLVRRVRALSPRTRCVLLTAGVEMHEVNEVVNEGSIRRLLYKPWIEDELKSTISELVEEYARSGEREADQKLLRELHLIRVAFDLLPTPMAVVAGADLVFAYANGPFARVTGNEVASLVGSPAQLHLPAAVCTGARALLTGPAAESSATVSDAGAIYLLRTLRDSHDRLGIMISVEAAARPASDGGSGPLEFRLDCRRAGVDDLLDNLDSAIRLREREGRPIRIVLENLTQLNGSVSKFLREILLRLEGSIVNLSFVDPSGLMKIILDSRATPHALPSK